MAIPPFRASPTSSCFRPSSTSRPRPGAPTIAAITTMPSAIMMVWLTPSIMDGLASGSWTFAQGLPRRGTERAGDLERGRGHVADAERGEPDRGRQGEDHGRDQRRRVADPEEQDAGKQVRVRGDRLHRVHERAQDPLRARLAARPHAERHPDRERNEDGHEHQGEGLDARLPHPEHAEREDAERGEQRHPPSGDEAGEARRADHQPEPRHPRERVDHRLDRASRWRRRSAPAPT